MSDDNEHRQDVTRDEEAVAAAKADDLRELEAAHILLDTLREALNTTRSDRFWSESLGLVETLSPVVPIELYGPEQRPVQSMLMDTQDGRKWLLVLIPTAIAS